MTDEVLEIYNERMELIGQKPRSEVHKNGYWHKSFHCWIVYKDKSGQTYIVLQKRSATKDVIPNRLDISVAGHLDIGEKPEDGLREIKEEMGIDVDITKLTSLGMLVEVYCDSNVINREFAYVYLLEFNKDIKDYKVQSEEIVALTRIKLEDGIDLFLKQKPFIQAYSINFDKNGMPIGQGEKHGITIKEFAGEERNNYFIKVFLLIKRYFEGEQNFIYLISQKTHAKNPTSFR